MRGLLVIVAVLAIAPAANAGRSPYVFARGAVATARTHLVQELRARFGTSASTRVTCAGWYPGAHGGVRGFHEVHCRVRVVVLGALSFRATAVYWIDRGKRVRVRQHVA